MVKSAIHGERSGRQITLDNCSGPHSLRSLAVLGLRHICLSPAPLRSPYRRKSNVSYRNRYAKEQVQDAAIPGCEEINYKNGNKN